MKRLLALACLAATVACGTDDGQQVPADTFAALQERGATAMGVDQYTSSHVFETLPNGGRIVLQRDTIDAAGTEAIRTHMRDIAGRFGKGDFTIPGMVHAKVVPGTDTMALKKASITYSADTLPRGGEVRIVTTDPGALRAVHAFLAFQRSEHHAGMEHGSMDHGSKTP